MFNNYDNIAGIDLFNNAVAKFGKEFEPIFAIMPEEKIQEYLKLDFYSGRSKLERNFKDFIKNK